MTRGWLTGPGLLLLGVAFVIPVLLIVQTSLFDPSFTSEHILRFFNRGVYVRVLFNTFEISAVVTVFCLLIGYPTAAYIMSRPKNIQPVLLFLVLVPLWMSILIRTYAWMVVLGRDGVINDALIWLGLTNEPLQLIYTSGAVYVGMIQILLPIMILTCYGTMTQIDVKLVRAARTMGASPFAAFRTIFVPLSAAGAINGMLAVFILSLGFFITPALIGGRRDAMLANLIASQVERGNWGFAGAMSLVLLISTLAVLVVVNLATRSLVYDASREKKI